MASGMLVNSNSVEKEEEETKALICSPTKCHGVNTPTRGWFPAANEMSTNAELQRDAWDFHPTDAIDLNKLKNIYTSKMT